MTVQPRPEPSISGVHALKVGACILLAVLMLAFSACGATTSNSGNTKTPVAAVPTSTVSCPTDTSSWHLVTAGSLTIASDTTYAPAEYPDPNNPQQFIGYDMDIARELARRLCLTPDIVKATFDAIIPSISGGTLGQQRYDMSISSFTITAAREQKVNFIPYFQAGESILTLTANPGNIKSINDMCGKTIAVQNGTTEKAEVEDANGTGDGSSGQASVCKSNKITILSFDDQTVVVQQVLNKRADGSYQDQPVTDYYASLHKGQLIDSGITVPPSPEGIVVRKDNPALQQAIQNALNEMRADGTYKRILQAWGQLNLAYPPLS
jgi:polar amino acid transport system substrate-binding protein